MIAFLRGTVQHVSLTSCILDVHGVGYLLSCTGATLATLAVGEEKTLHTYFVVREDAHDLYGFSDVHERDFFMLLMTVSGVGPKSALQILDRGHYTKIRNAISQGDLSYLTKMAGIGSKTAQKLILELREKVGKTEGSTGADDTDALEALTVLGYSLEDARATLQSIPATVVGPQARIKEALKLLGKKR